MSEILRAEMWDKMQYLFRNYYDRMMHCVLYFDGIIDEKLFKKALKFQIDKTPVLHSVYHNNFIKPYWVVKPYSIDDALIVRESFDLERDVDEFITQRIPIKSNVQLKIALFNRNGKTTFCMVLNHMCFDGGDLKYFVTRLCANYTKLASGDQNMYIKGGSRAYDRIYSTMSEEDKRVAKGLYKNISTVKDKHYFPLTPASAEDKNRVIKYIMPAEKFNAMRKAGKGIGFTVNDILLAVYVRALFEFCKFDPSNTLTIPCMVDLRRHLKEAGAETGLTNHTGFMPCTVHGVGKDIGETLDKVKEAMRANKEDKFLGLYSLPLLHLAYAVFPHAISEWAIKLGYNNPLIGMSNIGSIVPEDYSMGGIKPYDGFYTGAIKGKPFMQLALTTFNGAVTFSIAICGNDRDEKIVRDFFKAFDRISGELIDYAKSVELLNLKNKKVAEGRTEA